MSIEDRMRVLNDGTVEVNKACEFLSLPRSTVYELMTSGKLPYTKVGRRRLIPRRALVDLLEQGLVAVAAR